MRKVRLSLALIVLTVVISSCGQNKTEVVSASGLPQTNTSLTNVSGPEAQNIPFRTQRVENSLLYADLSVGMAVCIHREDGTVKNTDSAIVTQVSNDGSKLVTLQNSRYTLPITAAGYGLEPISPNTWANAWLTKDNCSTQ